MAKQITISLDKVHTRFLMKQRRFNNYCCCTPYNCYGWTSEEWAKIKAEKIRYVYNYNDVGDETVFHATLYQIEDELDTRENVPNKKAAKKLRQIRAQKNNPCRKRR